MVFYHETAHVLYSHRNSWFGAEEQNILKENERLTVGQVSLPPLLGKVQPFGASLQASRQC